MLSASGWTVAGIAALAVHGIVVWLTYHWQPAMTMPDEAPPAIEIELAPLAISSPVTPEQAGPVQRAVGGKPLPMPQQVERDDQAPEAPTPQEKPEPAEQPQAIEQERPQTTPPLPVPSPAVLPVPKNDEFESGSAFEPTPKGRKKPLSKKIGAERKRPPHPEKPERPQAPKPSTGQARGLKRAATPSTGPGGWPSASLSAWKQSLIVHLNRFKRSPPGVSGKGVARMAFMITRTGQVLSVRLAGSSGNTAFDAEAVALLRRASPVPAPPAGAGGSGSIALVVPIHFGR